MPSSTSSSTACNMARFERGPTGGPGTLGDTGDLVRAQTHVASEHGVLLPLVVGLAKSGDPEYQQFTLAR